jgi:hypothetical protein
VTKNITENRKTNLRFILKNLEKFCTDNDIRLGQAIEIIMNKNMDSLFNIENKDLNDLFIDYISKNQNLIK